MEKKKERILMTLTGSLTGAANGFFGGGGGMILVPLLIGALKKKTKTAHATAVLIILPVSVISGVIYFLMGSFDWKIALPVILGAAPAGFLGGLLLKKIPAKAVDLVFTALMIAAGVKMCFF